MTKTMRFSTVGLKFHKDQNVNIDDYISSLIGKTVIIDNILPLYSNKKSAQSAISVLVKKGLIKKVEKNVWQKLKNDIYDISNFK